MTAPFLVDAGGIACWEVPVSVGISNDARSVLRAAVGNEVFLHFPPCLLE